MSSYLGIPYNNPTGNQLPNFPAPATVTGIRCTNMSCRFPITGAPVENFAMVYWTPETINSKHFVHIVVGFTAVVVLGNVMWELMKKKSQYSMVTLLVTGAVSLAALVWAGVAHMKLMKEEHSKLQAKEGFTSAKTKKIILGIFIPLAAIYIIIKVLQLYGFL